MEAKFEERLDSTNQVRCPGCGAPWLPLGEELELLESSQPVEVLCDYCDGIFSVATDGATYVVREVL